MSPMWPGPPAPSDDTKDMLPGVKVSGLVLFCGGMLTAASGAFLAFNPDTQYVGAFALMPLGSAAMIIGIPLWALGAADIPADSEPRNPALLAGGTALAGLGGTGVIASTFVLWAGADDEVQPLPIFSMGLSGLAVIGGAIMAGYGATVVRSSDDFSEAPQLIPEVNIGAGRTELSWQF